jgi:predicted SAM-dependent methyltransferase
MRLYRSKYEEVANELAPNVRTLLDVGCRHAILKRYLPNNIQYLCVDLFPGPNVTRVCDAEQGLAFADNSIDAVVALDILEHTDNIWFAFEELVRVALIQIMIVLPNSYHWKARWRFLRRREGKKYKLPPEPIQDRHRWLTSYSSSRNFATNMADKFRLTLMTESIMVDQGKNVLREVAARFLSPDFMSTAAFFSFKKQPGMVFEHRIR